MPRNAVYGKRRNVGLYAASDFFDSSSPSSIQECDSPGLKSSKTLEPLEKDLTTVEVLVDQFQGLGVATSLPLAVSPEHEHDVEDGVLSELNNNGRNSRTGNSKKMTSKLSEKLDSIEVSALELNRKCSRRGPESQNVPKTVRRQNFGSQGSKDSETSGSPDHLHASSETLAKQVSSEQSRAPRPSPSLPELQTRRRPTRSKRNASLNAKNTYLQPLLSLTSESTGESGPTPYREWADALALYFNISKIAEASYGEVYRLALKTQNTTLRKCDESVLKIIPLKAPPSSSRKPAKDYLLSEVLDVANEVRLLQRMTGIPGFTNFREVRIMQGRPPPQFVAAWKVWNKQQSRDKKSQFPDPARKASYSETQLWAVIEMQDAGSDLEHRPCTDVWSAWDVFWGTTIALAKGEEEARFEHRDLHLGNICVKPTRSDETTHPILQPGIKIGYTGLETTIIDYTISRADMHAHAPDAEPDTDCDDVAYFDLCKDPVIFAGDSTEEYQYDIYRYMRAAALCNDPIAALPAPSPDSQSSRRDPAPLWRRYSPLTNLVWLHFLLYKLIEQVAAWPSCDPEPADDGVWDVALRLEQHLLELQSLLQLERMCDGGLRGSATGLVECAVARGWLDMADVLGVSASTASPASSGVWER